MIRPAKAGSGFQAFSDPLSGGSDVSDILVVQSKIRDMIKGKGCSTSADAIDALSAEVTRIINRAVERTKSNGRKTVKGSDI
jgi:hypothetical protein